MVPTWARLGPGRPPGRAAPRSSGVVCPRHPGRLGNTVPPAGWLDHMVPPGCCGRHDRDLVWRPPLGTFVTFAARLLGDAPVAWSSGCSRQHLRSSDLKREQASRYVKSVTPTDGSLVLQPRYTAPERLVHLRGCQRQTLSQQRSARRARCPEAGKRGRWAVTTLRRQQCGMD
jgi:hypothetical protein